MEVDGLTVVPPSVTGVTPEFLDRCTEVLLTEFTRMTGSPISLEDGPEAELVWPEPTGKSRSFLRDEDAPPPTQMLIQQIMQLDRCFRDLFVNPVVDALIDHAIGSMPFGGAKARRLSSTNSFVKWQGEHGYGESLGCTRIKARPLARGVPRRSRPTPPGASPNTPSPTAPSPMSPAATGPTSCPPHRWCSRPAPWNASAAR